MPRGKSGPSMQPDAVVVGSGINSLVCAALLARAGWGVHVLERNDYLGGAVKTAELAVAGFRHDVFSGWHSAWLTGRAHAALGAELAVHGLEYVNTDLPAATAFPDGSAAFLLRTAEETAAEFARHAPGDGAAWAEFVRAWARNAGIVRDLTQRDLGALSGSASAARAWRRLGSAGMLELSAAMVESSRDWLCRTFASEWVQRRARPLGAARGARARRGRIGVRDPAARARQATRRLADPERRRLATRRRARRCGGAARRVAGRRAGRRARSRLRLARRRRSGRRRPGGASHGAPSSAT